MTMSLPKCCGLRHSHYMAFDIVFFLTSMINIQGREPIRIFSLQNTQNINFTTGHLTSASTFPRNRSSATTTMCFYTRRMYWCRCPVAPRQLTAPCDNSRSGLQCCPNITHQYTRQYCHAHQYLDMFKDPGSKQPGPNSAPGRV